MREYRKKPDILEKCKPVKYDKRVEFVSPYYTAILDINSNCYIYYKGTSFLRAQWVLEQLPPDVFDAPEIPFSVFYPGRA